MGEGPLESHPKKITKMDSDKLQEWLVMIVKGLVSNPDSVVVEKTIDDMGVLYKVQVHEDDRGKVIGKEGSIGNAMRTLLRSAGRLGDIKASMQIDVPNSNFTPRDREA